MPIFVARSRRNGEINPVKCLRRLSILAFSFVLSVANAAFEADFSPQTDLSEVIEKEIQQATKSIDLAIYTFSSPRILSALEKAATRGVKLRLLVRKSVESGQPGFLAPLVQQGASIRWVSKINHHKFLVIDQSRLLTSSGNFSETELQKTYDENLIRCWDCDKWVAAFQEEFDFLYQNSNSWVAGQPPEDLRWTQSERPLPPSPNVALFTSRNFRGVTDAKRHVRRLESIDNKKRGAVEKRLIADIGRAQVQIQIATGHFRNWNLLSALSRAAQRGVKVTLVLDSQEYVSTYKKDAEQIEFNDCVQNGQPQNLCRLRGFHYSRHAFEAGIDVRMKFYALRWDFMRAPQMHHKYMIIDGKKLYTGSYNWSFNAEFESLENVLVTTDGKMLQAYSHNFAQVLAYGESELPRLIEKMRAEKTELGFYFPAMTLTYPEIDSLRFLACLKCPEVFCSSLIDEERIPAPRRSSPGTPPDIQPERPVSCAVTGS